MLYNSVSFKQLFSFKYFLSIKLNMRFNKLTAMELILSHFSNKHLCIYPIKNVVKLHTSCLDRGQDWVEYELHTAWTTQYCIAISFTSLLYTHQVYPIMQDETKLFHQCKTQTMWTDVCMYVIHHLLDSFHNSVIFCFMSPAVNSFTA
jgi:hypothetical protein